MVELDSGRMYKLGCVAHVACCCIRTIIYTTHTLTTYSTTLSSPPTIIFLFEKMRQPATNVAGWRSLARYIRSLLLFRTYCTISRLTSKTCKIILSTKVLNTTYSRKSRAYFLMNHIQLRRLYNASRITSIVTK